LASSFAVVRKEMQYTSAAAKGKEQVLVMYIACVLTSSVRSTTSECGVGGENVTLRAPSVGGGGGLVGVAATAFRA